MLAASIMAIPYVEIGLDQKLSFPKDSYLIPYFNNMSKYLHTGPPVYFVVKEGYWFERIKEQNKVRISYFTRMFSFFAKCNTNGISSRFLQTPLIFVYYSKMLTCCPI